MREEWLVQFSAKYMAHFESLLPEDQRVYHELPEIVRVITKLRYLTFQNRDVAAFKWNETRNSETVTKTPGDPTRVSPWHGGSAISNNLDAA